jgi:putative ABC transport system permease protein
LLSSTKEIVMLKNYIKTTFRNLRKNRTYSFLNLAGLGIGLAFASLIFLWVENELSFNTVFEKKDHLYRVMRNDVDGGQITTSGNTPGPLAAALKAEIPGIRNTARLSWTMPEQIEWQEKSIKDLGLYADPSILTMLSLKLLVGDPRSALESPTAVVISETLAKNLFGNENPVGKTVSMNAREGYSVDGLYTVKAVFRDLPQNSSYRFSWISPYSVFEDKNGWIKPWTNSLTETIVELDPSASVASVDQKLKKFVSGKTKTTAEHFLFSMNDWYLRNEFVNGKIDGGRIKYVSLFSLVAIIVLIIACINFMNLATARSEQRAKEVGVRKVMGAVRRMLVGQFIGESLMMAFLAILLAVGIVYLVIPFYNELVGKTLNPDVLRPGHLAFLISIGLVTGVLAGIYPAFYLSAFNPVKVLKGTKLKTAAGAIFIRKGLVIMQFTVSIALIICTTIIYQQIRYIKSRDLGFNKEKLITMNVPNEIKNHFGPVKDQLLATGVVENVAMSLHGPLQLFSFSDSYEWQGKDPNNKIFVHSNAVSPEYISTMRLKMLTGTDFKPGIKTDSSNVIINESLAKLMGKEGKVGSTITAWKRNYQVAGIVKDFVFNDMYGSNMPAIIFCNSFGATLLTIRVKDNADLATAVSKTEAVIRRNNQGQPFEFSFVDEQFDEMFTTETLISKLAGIFASLAIIISCLGLFGLAAYTAERRTKEIGIRKVLGASSGSLAGLLSKEFLQLVAVSCIISFPLAWWTTNSWLQNYQYRTDIKWWVFGLAGVTALLIALITVSVQSVKVAMANPVKSLRTE